MPILPQIPIVDVWRRLGGAEPKRSGGEYRGRAFWRDGDALSVAIDPEKNCYYDFRDSSGGGVLALVELILGCGQREALEWLRDEFGLEDSRAQATPEQRRIQVESERMEADMQPAYRVFLRELEARRNELIRLLRVAADEDTEMELAFVYSRIATMRDAIDGDRFDDDAIEVTLAIVKLLSEVE